MNNKFKEELQKLFPSLELTNLNAITKKIALVPQIRVGDLLECTDYEEVSLLNSTSEGGVLITTSQAPSSPANADLVDKHSLNKGDLLLSYRARNNIKVLRVKDTPKRAMVGNTATVRIEFNTYNIDILPVLIQSYLQLDVVQKYLINKAIENKESKNTRRFLVSPKILKDLPVPQFKIDSDVEFEQIMVQRTHLIDISGDILQQMKRVYIKSDDLMQLSLPSYINTPGKLKQDSLRDKRSLEKMKRLKQCLKDVFLEMESYFKDEVL